MKNFIILVALAVVALVPVSLVFAAPAARNFEGIVMQVNRDDGSFTMRLRDGGTVVVQTPIVADFFLNVKGVFEGGVVRNTSQITVKDKSGADAIPNILSIEPGSGQVGAKIKLAGSGFTRRNNVITIGTVRNAVIGVPSADGKTLSFTFPASPCDQKAGVNCPANVLAPGNYTIAVTNANGMSNSVPFSVLPLPPLSITTELLPQAMGGARYRTNIEAMGGTESYIWRVSEGKLPQGLVLAQAACTDTPCKSGALIAGTPTVPGTYSFIVTLISGQEVISRQFVMVVVQPLGSPTY